MDNMTNLSPLQPHLTPPADEVYTPARRILALELSLVEKTQMLTDALQALTIEIHCKERAQEALIKSQGVESFGFLADGLAHEMGNILVAMAIGYEVLQLKSSDTVVLKVAKNGGLAVQQAHQLIKSLQGFMHRRKNLPKVITPGDWLLEMEDMLGYAVGPFMACHLQAAADVWPVRVDESCLGAALINLVVNARHALPDGGEISVEVNNLPQGASRPQAVPDGDFVVFCVNDNGAGMTPKALAEATAPFFSTSAPAQERGLGLPLVQGFAHANAGYLHIDSQPGAGTRVALYLPRSEDITPSAPGVTDSALRPARPLLKKRICRIETL